MIDALWDKFVRWRTYIVNGAVAATVAPDAIAAIQGFDWHLIVPAQYMPYVTLGLVVLNVWMRPRPAARARDFRG